MLNIVSQTDTQIGFPLIRYLLSLSLLMFFGILKAIQCTGLITERYDSP